MVTYHLAQGVELQGVYRGIEDKSARKSTYEGR
jgi:hypothetical protein